MASTSSLGRRQALAGLLVLAAAPALPAWAAEKGGAAKVDPNAPVFIKLDPINVTVFDRGAARGKLTVELRLDVLQKAQAAKVESLKPRLQDSYLREITAYSNTMGDKPPDLDQLLTKFQQATDQTLGATGIAKVLVHHAQRTL